MRFRPIIGWLLTALLASGACTVRNDREVPEAEQPQSLSLGVGAGTVNTKANSAVITELLSTNDSPQFRGLSEIKVIPFFTGLGVKVRPTDVANGYARLFPDIEGSVTDAQVFNGHHFHEGLLEGSHAHYFSGSHALFSSGTTAMLVYARATEPELPEEPLALRAHKQLYGSLMENGWTGEDDSYPTPADIGFTPESIYGSDIFTTAGEMAALLTVVASTSATVHYYYHNFDQLNGEADASAAWSADDLGCPELHNAFLNFVSDVGEGPRLIPGACVNLLSRLKVLEAFLDSFDCDNEEVIMHGTEVAYISVTETLKKRDVHNALRDQLKINVQACISGLSASYSHYPRAYGIPSGSSFLLWDGAAFQPVPEALDGWVPASQYCYMPALYYYGNSALSTSYSSDIYQQYADKTWDQIVALHTAGKMITRNTRVVALDDPLQFACGMLVATVQATVNPLHDRGDANEFTLDYDSEDFPVTGLVIGGQYPQHYDFTPVTDDDAEVVRTEQFLFDSNVSDTYVNTVQSVPFRTLALPTPLEREVYFYLELCNNSGKDFNGADGIIPKGSRFYLAGKIPAPSQEDIANGVNRVFMQDCVTRLTCKITSLENAYLCIPQMGKPELVLGVQTKANWFFSSTYVVLG